MLTVWIAMAHPCFICFSLAVRHVLIFMVQVIECVPMSQVEKELVAIAQHLVRPLAKELVSYCFREMIPFNPSLQLLIDAIQITVACLNGGGFFRHSDTDTSNTDDMCTPDEMSLLNRAKINAIDTQVLTMVVSCAKPEHDINLRVYYPKESETEIASIPSLGPVHAHLQYLLMQVAEHEVSNANCPRGEGYRIVISFRCMGPFQQSRAMVRTYCVDECPCLFVSLVLTFPFPPKIAERLRKHNVSLDRKDWVTKEQYNMRSDGKPIKSAAGAATSVSSFPGISSSLVGNICQNVVAADRRLQLGKDQWPALRSASAKGEIAEILRSGLILSKNRETWETVTSGPYMERLIPLNYVVDVSQKVSKARSGKVSTGVERIRFGPLLDDDPEEEGQLKLVWPGTCMNAMQVAESLSLTFKDQNHSICRTDSRLVADISLQLLYRNDVTGIVKTLNFWRDARIRYENCSSNIHDDESFLGLEPPEIWFASAGGGGITAGSKGCPSFASSRARKDLPDGYIGGGKKDTPLNRALDSVFLRKVSWLFNLDLVISHG